MANLSEHIHHIAFQAKQASREIAKAGPEQKNALPKYCLKRKEAFWKQTPLILHKRKKMICLCLKSTG